VVTAREVYDDQVFNFAGPVGDYGFLEEYTTQIRGVPTKVVVLVTFNTAGREQASRGEPPAAQCVVVLLPLDA
jgi:hypothetical protein